MDSGGGGDAADVATMIKLADAGVLGGAAATLQLGMSKQLALFDEALEQFCLGAEALAERQHVMSQIHVRGLGWINQLSLIEYEDAGLNALSFVNFKEPASFFGQQIFVKRGVPLFSLFKDYPDKFWKGVTVIHPCVGVQVIRTKALRHPIDDAVLRLKLMWEAALDPISIECCLVCGVAGLVSIAKPSASISSSSSSSTACVAAVPAAPPPSRCALWLCTYHDNCISCFKGARDTNDSLLVEAKQFRIELPFELESLCCMCQHFWACRSSQKKPYSGFVNLRAFVRALRLGQID